jgi:two-component system sensor histidine kinase PilS (NtrC family)
MHTENASQLLSPSFAPAFSPAGRDHPLGRAGYPSWGALRWLFLCRVLVVAGLMLVFAPPGADPLVPRADSALAWSVLLGYGCFVLLSGLALYLRWPSRENQVHLAVFVDIVALTLLMHAAGGVASGLGVLLAVSVAAGALLMEGRISLLYAALATLAVIAEHTYGQLAGAMPTAAYTQAGLLGVMFFAVALLAHVLYRRVHDVEELAARRKVDIDDLSKLNEFIIQNMSTGVMVIDGERQLRLMNQSARDLLDIPDAPPGTELRKLTPQVADWLEEHVRPNAPQGGVVMAGDREVKPTRQLLGDYRAAGVLLYLRDNQELSREAQQIKLASLGTLTASIAHNIRNPLSAISHAGQLLAEAQGLSDDDRHLLDIIRRNSGRIDEIVSSVLQLSRRNQVEPRMLDLVAWTEELGSELREGHGLGEDFLQIECAEPPIVVEADTRHLHQIVANLCENAIVHGGTPDRPAHIRLRALRDPDRHRALLEVCDDGPGIDEETAREMFAPFYTTRSTGTGLGLYIARELAETNGVQLSYHPVVPNGSCFRLEFP